MAGGAEETNLEYTPTWVVALVCTVIVSLSLVVERILHYTGKYLKKKKQKSLYEALLKIKEELMLLGFISLMLNVFQDRINKMCMAEHLADKWLPCSKETEIDQSAHATTAHFTTSGVFSSFASSHGHHRHLLAGTSAAADYCASQGEVPLLSTTALHHLHIFIFVLAVAHVVFSALTIVFGAARIQLQWKHWEDSILKKERDTDEALKQKFTNVREHDFIKSRFLRIGEDSALRGWLHSFLKQFYGAVTKSDYTTLRLGFIMTHCRGNPKFNFHKYMVRALEADFKKVVGISWYLWSVVVLFLLLNVHGWHAYFYISFIPIVLLLAVGTKLEHVIIQLAQEVAEKHVAIEGDLIVKPSDDHFWFHRPRLVLLLIHIILFQNAFEIAIFFWIWVQYKFNSCMMGQIGFVIPRLVIGAFVQFVASYSTLPLYAIVTQMGSSFKKAIFEERVQEGIDEWVRRNKGLRKASNGSSQSASKGKEPSPSVIQLIKVPGQLKEDEAVESTAKDAAQEEIQPLALASANNNVPESDKIILSDQPPSRGS